MRIIDQLEHFLDIEIIMSLGNERISLRTVAKSVPARL